MDTGTAQQEWQGRPWKQREMDSSVFPAELPFFSAGTSIVFIHCEIMVLFYNLYCQPAPVWNKTDAGTPVEPGCEVALR